MDDQHYMRLALRLAARGAGRTAPNPMVGAVVVREARIVGRGFHRHAGGAHAEVEALAAAGVAAAGATLYVTLEPCNHTGRTPPCTDAILQAGIRRVVAAMRDPNPHVAGQGLARLAAAGCEVVLGPGAEQAARLNEAWLTWLARGRPHVTVKCAATLDGRIATRDGDARWVTGEAARQWVHRLRDTSDAILVGIGTVLRDDPQLTTRLAGRRGKDPLRVILDSRLRLPASARVLDGASSAGTLVFCGPEADATRRRRLENAGADIVPVDLIEKRLALTDILTHLGRMGITSLLVEGGATVIGSLLAARLVDKLVLFLAPKLLGGVDGVPICRGPGAARMADALPLGDMRLRRLGKDLMLAGYLDAV
jgi:diaminohydroxyphosphoribosylaminopyrimidine deaminase/5-amino-6-(5-phosphoribosylamino)uracil reductase